MLQKIDKDVYSTFEKDINLDELILKQLLI